MVKVIFHNGDQIQFPASMFPILFDYYRSGNLFSYIMKIDNIEIEQHVYITNIEQLFNQDNIKTLGVRGEIERMYRDR